MHVGKIHFNSMYSIDVKCMMLMVIHAKRLVSMLLSSKLKKEKQKNKN